MQLDILDVFVAIRTDRFVAHVLNPFEYGVAVVFHQKGCTPVRGLARKHQDQGFPLNTLVNIGIRPAEMVLSIDLAPTILEFAGADIDQRILAPIAEWDRLLRDYTSFAERARRSVDMHLLPALTLRGDVGPQLMIPTTFNNRSEPPPYRDEKVTIRIDEEVKGFVAERWRNGSSAINRLEAARKAAEAVVAAIDATQAN